jgi:hypothetical protein
VRLRHCRLRRASAVPHVRCKCVGIDPNMVSPMSGRARMRSLRLNREELDALVAVLYVVKDNWWLSEIEEEVLQRLELLDLDGGETRREPPSIAAARGR